MAAFCFAVVKFKGRDALFTALLLTLLIPPQVTLIPMYFELDGTFPHHDANPLEQENVAELKERVVAEGADLGAAFDGDADRMFLVDEHGKFIGGDMTTVMVADLVALPPGPVPGLRCVAWSRPLGYGGGMGSRPRRGHSRLGGAALLSGHENGGSTTSDVPGDAGARNAGERASMQWRYATALLNDGRSEEALQAIDELDRMLAANGLSPKTGDVSKIKLLRLIQPRWR